MPVCRPCNTLLQLLFLFCISVGGPNQAFYEPYPLRSLTVIIKWKIVVISIQYNNILNKINAYVL